MRFWDKIKEQIIPTAQSLPEVRPNQYISSKEISELAGRYFNAINTRSIDGQAKAYASCSIVASIITKKVSAIGDARYWMQDANGEDIDRPKEMAQISRPNQFQTLPEFVCMIQFFSQIFGKAYIVKVSTVGFADFELYVIPNTMVTENEMVTVSAENPFAPRSTIKDYTLTIGNGSVLNVSKEDMFVVGDTSYSLNKFGDYTSRLEVLANPINTFIASYEATNELLVNRGMLGIISLMSDDPLANSVMPATKEDKKALEDQLNKYGIIKNRLQYAITAFKAAYIPVSSTISDLGLTDIQRNCKKDIAYTYQVPSILLDVEGSTYSNFGEAKLEFYTNDIIPSANNIMRTINRIYGFEGFGIKAFFDHLELFQNSKRQQAAGMTSLVSALNQAVQAGLMSVESAKNELEKYMI